MRTREEIFDVGALIPGTKGLANREDLLLEVLLDIRDQNARITELLAIKQPPIKKEADRDPSSLKKGDMVWCVDYTVGYGASGLIQNKMYRVDGCDSEFVRVNDGNWFSSRFRPVNVGDKVRMATQEQKSMTGEITAINTTNISFFLATDIECDRTLAAHLVKDLDTCDIRLIESAEETDEQSPESEIKKGDFVWCVCAESNLPLTKNKMYQITEDSSGLIPVKIKDDNGINSAWCQLEPNCSEDISYPIVRPVRVGDKVDVIYSPGVSGSGRVAGTTTNLFVRNECNSQLVSPEEMSVCDLRLVESAVVANEEVVKEDVQLTKYRSKKIVEAVQWFKDESPAVTGGCYIHPGSRRKSIPGLKDNYRCGKCDNAMRNHGYLNAYEQSQIVCPGDWIVTDTEGDHRCYEDKLFHTIYEKVEGE